MEHNFCFEKTVALFKRGREPKDDTVDDEWEDTNGGPIRHNPSDKRADPGPHPCKKPAKRVA